MSDLARCPFCGSEPEHAPYELRCVNPLCEAQPSVSGGNEAEAIAAWNRRPESAPAKEVERDAARLDALEALFASGEVPAWQEFMTQVAHRGFRAALDAAMSAQENKG